jgi:hypothetical protein
MVHPYAEAMDEQASDRGKRLGAARRRARAGKAGLFAVALAVFGGGMLLTRNTAAGHVKHAAQPLAAPARFVNTVRQNALAAGSIAPPQSPPPQASTSQS